MREEIEAAATFITRLINKNLSSFTTDKTEQFRQNLTNVLYERFHDHWFPEQPTKGQAYRCIRLNESDRNDPILSLTCLQCGIDYSDLQLPLELTVWVDPEEVTCRFGEYKGSHCLVAKFRNGQLQEDYINQIDIDDNDQKTKESIRQASFDLAKPRTKLTSTPLHQQQQQQRRDSTMHNNQYHQIHQQQQQQQQAKNQHHNSPASIYKQQQQQQQQLQQLHGDINGNINGLNGSTGLVGSTANMSLNVGVSPMTNHTNNNNISNAITNQTNLHLLGSSNIVAQNNNSSNINNNSVNNSNRSIETDYQQQTDVDAATASSAMLRQQQQQMRMSPFHNTAYMYSPSMMKYIPPPMPSFKQQQQANSIYRNSFSGQSPVSSINQIDSQSDRSTPTSSSISSSSSNSNQNVGKFFQQAQSSPRVLPNIQMNPVMNYFQAYCPYPTQSNDRYHYTKSIVKV